MFLKRMKILTIENVEVILTVTGRTEMWRENQNRIEWLNSAEKIREKSKIKSKKLLFLKLVKNLGAIKH